LKVYPPEILSEMDSLLARAQRAAAKETDPVYAKHALHARATTVDHMILSGAEANAKWGVTRKPHEGKRWWVAGGRQDLAERISRMMDVHRIGDLGEFGPGQMMAAFEDATAALKVGEMSGLVGASTLPARATYTPV